ncbi:MAG TPA: hypothetical protein VHM68_04620 [Candidatus Deferrimicrobium sp.]|nr:hypothetical protein [Candidatus Deferrimicrobium sp.]
MNLLGIIGSPRKMGNYELMVEEIAVAVPGAPKLSMVRLVEKDLRPCKACYRCLTGDCPHQDDFSGVLRAIMTNRVSINGAAALYVATRNTRFTRASERHLHSYIQMLRA